MTALQPISADPNGAVVLTRQAPAPVPDHTQDTGQLAIINRAGEPHGKIGQQLGRLGFGVVYLQEHISTLDKLSTLAGRLSAVILDWRSEDAKDGRFAEALAVKAAELGLPVLTFVAASRTNDIRIVSEAGMSNILPIPCQLADLKTALDTLVSRSWLDRQNSGFGLNDAAALLESCRFRFRTPDDVEKLVPLIAGIFPDPARTAPGIAELMMNAIEHGNLEIGHDRKGEWIARGIYRNELLKRLQTPPYSNRRAELILNRRDDGVMVVIMDEGCGFCWQDVIYDDPHEKGAVTGEGGEGLAKAKRDSFDDLRFNHVGNQVMAFVSDESQS